MAEWTDRQDGPSSLRSGGGDSTGRKISLRQIIRQHNREQEQARLQTTSSHEPPKPSEQQIYEVNNADPYAESFQKAMIVKIRIFDVFYNEQVCSLVHIQDLTLFYRDVENEKKNEKLLTANACISEELAVP